MKNILIFAILFSTCLLHGQWSEWQQIHVDVIYLASDDLEGRETGSQGEKLAADYIAHRMQNLNLVAKGKGGSWFQDFIFSPGPHGMDSIEKKGKNVLGFLDRKASKTVIIGAHYDHLGRGEHGSLAPNDRNIHNGADDNASGIASLLWLAESLSKEPNLPFNLLFVAFSGEEYGLFGSKAVAAQVGFDSSTILAMINMDMVGRLNAEKSIAVGGTGTCTEWPEILEKCKPKNFTFNYTVSGIGPSDHTSFYLKSIPVLFFFTGQHNDYHKPTDDSPLINYVGILEVSRIILDVVIEISRRNALHFQKTKDDGQKSSSFKVTMGIMPDYVYAGQGMRIDAVLDDRPAKKAGIQGGDIIIEMAGQKVKDIYEYMAALGKCAKGQKATVKVMRKEKELVFEVEF